LQYFNHCLSQHRTLQIARELASSGAALIAVSHGLNLAAQYADCLITINDGSIQADASPATALKAR